MTNRIADRTRNPVRLLLAASTAFGALLLTDPAAAQSSATRVDAAPPQPDSTRDAPADPEPERHRRVEDSREIGVLAGLLQPIFTQGGNVQLEAAYGRAVFDYSHGFLLDLPPVGAAKSQGLDLHVPYTTGFGVGYRFTEDFDVRFEPKLHKFEVSYGEGPERGERVATYHTITLGLGAYYRWRPFRKLGGAAKGITIAPSFRIWPNVWSSLDGNKVVYQSSVTGQEQTHRASNIGLGNTPFIANISVGYVFSL